MLLSLVVLLLVVFVFSLFSSGRPRSGSRADRACIPPAAVQRADDGRGHGGRAVQGLLQQVCVCFTNNYYSKTGQLWVRPIAWLIRSGLKAAWYVCRACSITTFWIYMYLFMLASIICGDRVVSIVTFLYLLQAPKWMRDEPLENINLRVGWRFATQKKRV